MNAVNLDTLLGNVVAVLVHEARVVEGEEVPVLILGVVEVQVMVMAAGVLAHVGEDLQDGVAYHHFVVVATAGLLHTVILAAFHLMPMEIKIRMQLEQMMNNCWEVLSAIVYFL